LQRISAAREQGDLIAVAILTRAHVRLSPRDASRWRALAAALKRLGDEAQSRRCEAVAAAIPQGNDAKRTVLGSRA
jgi:Flp pilus assembly protein TadD